MKKLLVSDYDGTYTLNFDNNNIAVKKYVKDNNFFMFSTGRNYKSFTSDIKDDMIANYYSFSNGNVLMNNELKVLSYIAMPYNFIIQLKEYFNKIDDIDYLNMYGELDKKDIVEYYIKCSNIQIRKELINFLINNKYFNYHRDYNNELGLFISNPESRKTDNIKKVAFIEKINDKDIYTIGDSFNDIDMIKEYNGYAIKGSNDVVKEYAKKEYDSVSSLTEDIRKGKI